jgi:hypothetical protein
MVVAMFSGFSAAETDSAGQFIEEILVTAEKKRSFDSEHSNFN